MNRKKGNLYLLVAWLSSILLTTIFFSLISPFFSQPINPIMPLIFLTFAVPVSSPFLILVLIYYNLRLYQIHKSLIQHVVCIPIIVIATFLVIILSGETTIHSMDYLNLIMYVALPTLIASILFYAFCQRAKNREPR